MGRFTIGSLESVLKTNWVDLFPVARSLGFDCVELGVRGDDYLWTELWTAEGLRALKDRSEQAHIPIASICLHTFWKYTFQTATSLTEQPQNRSLSKPTTPAASSAPA